MLAKLSNLVSGNKPRSPEILVRDTKNALEALLNAIQSTPLPAAAAAPGTASAGATSGSDSIVEEKHKKLLDERRNVIQKCLAEMKTVVAGNWMKVKDTKKAKGPVEEEISSLEEQLVDENNHLIIQLTSHLRHLPFEARKDLAHIVAFLVLRRTKRNLSGKGSSGGGGGGSGSSTENKFVEYLIQNPSIIETLKNNFEVEGCELNCVEMLKAMAQRKKLANFMLRDETKVYLKFLTRYCMSEKFEVCTESFEFLRVLLTYNSTVKELAAGFLASDKNYVEFFKAYNVLLLHPKYIVRRMALELLGRLLLDRRYFNVMMKYISDRVNLALIMSMLSENNESIQVEAFHVFKVFVANPRKNESIVRVLRDNANKLIRFLDKLEDNREDSTFGEEKELTIMELKKLLLQGQRQQQAEASSSPPSSSSSSSTKQTKETKQRSTLPNSDSVLSLSSSSSSSSSSSASGPSQPEKTAAVAGATTTSSKSSSFSSSSSAAASGERSAPIAEETINATAGTTGGSSTSSSSSSSSSSSRGEKGRGGGGGGTEKKEEEEEEEEEEEIAERAAGGIGTASGGNGKKSLVKEGAPESLG